MLGFNKDQAAAEQVHETIAFARFGLQTTTITWLLPLADDLLALP